MTNILNPNEHQQLANERVNQAFKRIGISSSWGYKLIEDKILPLPHPIVPGGRGRAFLKSDIDAYIMACHNSNVEVK
jgi:predicted DNA-binding transcriptional regulator AlpA